jgi:hypothetical protein
MTDSHRTTERVACDFCGRKFDSVVGLRTHALRAHDAEIKAAAEYEDSAWPDPFTEHFETYNE